MGKNFLASALGHQACALGYKTLYFNTAKLFSKLHGAKADNALFKADNALFKEILKISRHDLLILDDFGLQTLENNHRESA